MKRGKFERERGKREQIDNFFCIVLFSAMVEVGSVQPAGDGECDADDVDALEINVALFFATRPALTLRIGFLFRCFLT